MQNPKQYPDQIIKADSINRNVEMNSVDKTNAAANTPLYSSPWLAFFYMIKQGWGQPRP